MESYADAEVMLQVISTTTDPVILESLFEEAASRPQPVWILPQALALWHLGRTEQMIEVLSKASKDQEKNPLLWLLRGMAFRRLPDGRGENAAKQAYQCGLDLDPTRGDLHYNLANLLYTSNPQAAEHHYRSSLKYQSWQASCWHNLGMLLHEQERYSSAIAVFRTSLLLQPVHPEAWCNLGLAYLALELYGQAESCFAQAIALDPLQSASHTNMGTLLVARLEPERALAFLERGFELDRNSSHALFNLSLCQLLLGRFESGWAYYDARLQTHLVPPECVPTVGARLMSLAEAPQLGELPLVVWAEQGLGDTIQFCRYLGLLDAIGISYEFLCPEPLLRLMQNWLKPGGRVAPLPLTTDCNDDRAHSPLMSLPRLFATREVTIPGAIPYLRAPEEPPEHLRVLEPAGGLAVGLVWAANASNKAMYRHKCIPLGLLMPRLLNLVDLDLIDLHALQVGPDHDQLAPWIGHPRIMDWAPRLGDFADTAHVVSQLDLVIAVDTAVAHLAAALNRPTWLLLPSNADFRWLRGRWDSPWYPGCMRLFRQTHQGDWSAVVHELHQALDRLFLLDLQALAAAKLRS